jgi:hypothetical protein
VPPARLNELGETVNRDLYKVKSNVFVEKTVVASTPKSPANHGIGNRNPRGR